MLPPGLAGAHLQIQDRKFFADLLVGRPKCLGHLERGLIEPEAGLDTDHHEVGRAGEAPFHVAKATPTISKSAFSRRT
jgi:hypothetical protein